MDEDLNEILDEAKVKYDFYETQTHHSKFIYNFHNPKRKLKVIDICCGRGSLIDPWYNKGHETTLIELNEKLLPYLKQTYPKAKILNQDFLINELSETNYDVFLCNPPFRNENGKSIYPYFFL
jgi:16S rRNA A1518/A1519 N6-dimethyltransferase RsmA/KsgA/DIM1 with predicted DNA glycosylase/AP lyase activity